MSDAGNSGRTNTQVAGEAQGDREANPRNDTHRKHAPLTAGSLLQRMQRAKLPDRPLDTLISPVTATANIPFMKTTFECNGMPFRAVQGIEIDGTKI